MPCRLLPYTIQQEKEIKVDVVYRTVAEVRRELASRGIDMELVTRILHQPAEVIDHESVVRDSLRS